MTAPSRFAIHAAVIWLVCGALLGGYGLAAPVVGLPFDRHALVPAHVSIMLFGWLFQMVLAVAWWMFPRRTEDRGTSQAGADGRGNESRVAVVLLTYNVALAVNVGGGIGKIPPIAIGGQAAVLLAMAAFVSMLAPRVRPFGDASPGGDP